MRPTLRVLGWVAACIIGAEAFVAGLAVAVWVVTTAIEEG